MTYTIFTRSAATQGLVHIISEADDYADATRIARCVGGCIKFTDQFQSYFTPTSINGLNGMLA